MDVEFWGIQKLLEENSTITSLSLRNVTLTEDNYKILFSPSNKITSLELTPESPIPAAAFEVLIYFIL